MQDKIDINTINKIFELLNISIDNPVTELNYTNNFTLLVAVILSAQSTDKAVNKATKELLAKYDTPEKMLKCGIERLKEYIKTIGLYNNKAANIMKTSEILIASHNSEVPNNFTTLIQLPGVGKKTANVILNCAFDQGTIAVDTHVSRVSKRLGLTDSNNPDKISDELITLIPIKWHKIAHHLLVLHGRYICTALKPKCDSCVINNYCKYFNSKT